MAPVSLEARMLSLAGHVLESRLREYLALALLAVAWGCRAQVGLPAGVMVACATDAECPESYTCRLPLGRCVQGSVIARCGDGVIDFGEVCDDGNDGNDDECTNTCALPTCGDGILQAGEGCDEAEANADDRACTSRCVAAACGDGLIQVGVEACDAAAENADDGACTTACQPNVCGDGLRWQGVEVCDDGNADSGDGCRGDCRKIELCGDAEVDAGEGCDDGNANAADGCHACLTTTWLATQVTGSNAAAISAGLYAPPRHRAGPEWESLHCRQRKSPRPPCGCGDRRHHHGRRQRHRWLLR